MLEVVGVLDKARMSVRLGTVLEPIQTYLNRMKYLIKVLRRVSNQERVKKSIKRSLDSVFVYMCVCVCVGENHYFTPNNDMIPIKKTKFPHKHGIIILKS